jgi:aspartate 4-decarboxylase
MSHYEHMSPFEFKNILLEEAGKVVNEDKPLLNAGRGNPNFLNTTVRDAFAYLQHFMSRLSDELSDLKHLGIRPPKKGIAKKLVDFLNEHHSGEAAEFLRESINFAENEFNLRPDDFVYELGDAAQGSFYPSPPRIFPQAETIFNDYLHKILGGKFRAKHFDLFATEGATMAMVYIFNTLKENRLLNPGDHIAIVTPIFSPYLEIPALEDYQLKQIHIKCTQASNWQLTQQQVDKLKDPNIKALYLVNPSNPPGVKLDEESCGMLVELVEKHRPDLTIITDDVYSTFVEDYMSLAYLLPRNTICAYSYSKYFGVTGWRLGLVMVHPDNIFDEKIQKLPVPVEKALDKRYRLDSADPRHIKFIDRLEIDSRDVALAHTGGVSTIQQGFMCLLSLFELMDTKNVYKENILTILKHRVNLLQENMGLQLLSGPGYTHYYAMVSLRKLASNIGGEEFAQWFSDNVSTFDFLLRLARETATVCLPGAGFGGEKETIRFSLANLADDDYIAVGKNVAGVMRLYQREMGA